MSVASAHQVAPVVQLLADEIAAVHRLLAQYEDAVMPVMNPSAAKRRELQGFDLAQQMLKDLEHLSRAIAAQLPEGITTKEPLQAPGLKLERTRHRLSVSVGTHPPQKRPEPRDSVDLF